MNTVKKDGGLLFVDEYGKREGSLVSIEVEQIGDSESQRVEVRFVVNGPRGRCVLDERAFVASEPDGFTAAHLEAQEWAAEVSRDIEAAVVGECWERNSGEPLKSVS